MYRRFGDHPAAMLKKKQTSPKGSDIQYVSPKLW